MHQKQNYSIKLDTARYIVLGSNEHVEGLNNKKQYIMGGTPQIGHSGFDAARNTNVKELQNINTYISVVKEYLKNS